MVTFSCDHCQQSVTKPKVESHRARCHNCWYLTCIDCSKTLDVETYKAHTQCISEAEKYQGKLYQGGKKVRPCVVLPRLCRPRPHARAHTHGYQNAPASAVPAWRLRLPCPLNISDGRMEPRAHTGPKKGKDGTAREWQDDDTAARAARAVWSAVRPTR